jgi:hypothetical protein
MEKVRNFAIEVVNMADMSILYWDNTLTVGSIDEIAESSWNSKVILYIPTIDSEDIPSWLFAFTHTICKTVEDVVSECKELTEKKEEPFDF